MRIALLLAFLLLSVLTVVGQIWRRPKGGHQENRVRSGMIRVPKGLEKSRRTSCWLIAFFVVFGGVPLLAFVGSRIVFGYFALVLLDSGKETTAVITTEGLPREESTYTFEVEGRSYSGKAAASLSKGQRLQIVYAPSSPWINRPAGGLLPDVGIGVIFMGAVVLSLSLAFGRLLVRRPAIDTPEHEVAQCVNRADFRGAIEVFRTQPVFRQDTMLLATADVIVTACCEFADLEVYDEGASAIDQLRSFTSDDSTLRELAYFHKEIELSAEVLREAIAKRRGRYD